MTKKMPFFIFTVQKLVIPVHVLPGSTSLVLSNYSTCGLSFLEPIFTQKHPKNKLLLRQALSVFSMPVRKCQLSWRRAFCEGSSSLLSVSYTTLNKAQLHKLEPARFSKKNAEGFYTSQGYLHACDFACTTVPLSERPSYVGKLFSRALGYCFRVINQLPHITLCADFGRDKSSRQFSFTKNKTNRDKHFACHDLIARFDCLSKTKGEATMEEI